MNVSGLLALFNQLEPYRNLLESLSRGSCAGQSLGLPRAARTAMVASLHRDLSRPVLLVVARVDHAQKMVEDLTAWSPTPEVMLRFPEPTPLPYDRAPWGESARNNRLSILNLMLSIGSTQADSQPGQPPVIVTSARALLQKTLPPRDFLAHTRRLKVGQSIQLEKLLEAWLHAGYRPATVVEEAGTFSRRGGILDICPPAANRVPDAGKVVGIRVELFGDEVESLRSFDLATQRTLVALDTAIIPPACEALPRHGARVAAQLRAGTQMGDWREDLGSLSEAAPFPGIEFYLPYFYQQPAILTEYLTAETLVLVDDWAALRAETEELDRRAGQLRAEREEAGALPPGYPPPIWDWETMYGRLQARGVIALGGLMDGAALGDLAAAFTPGPRYGGQVKPMLENLIRLHGSGKRTVVVSRQAARLADLWHEHGPFSRPVRDLYELPEDGTLTFVQGALSDGFHLGGRVPATGLDRPGTPAAGESLSLLHLFTDGEIFGWTRPEPRQAARPRAAAPETHFGDISPGDLVVHVDHGIGRFEGLVTKRVGGTAHEYLLITYAESDQLYVPTHQADRLSRYVGLDDSHPLLNRLGGISWTQTKAKTQEAVEEIADELLELYAARATVVGHAFSPDSSWQAELEASFPYVETDDQLRVISQVKQDMERPQPMDRLVCGDVGYGKTEVALRSAFKAVMDGKQVGVLVPTTVLAQQHFNNFTQRLATFPVEIRMLSRFRSREEQSRILSELAAGRADIVIGTHRLLQKDVSFKDLGLLVVDEEQRFGVAHKEMLKKMRTEVDVLTMTATPIPRTLYMSLTGVRDISLITTPPEERLPVQTHVGSYDLQLVRRSILRELDRHGQVFFVHNRVETISSVAQHLRRLLPEARLAIGHGQMNERELENVMLSFVAGDVDVLVSTSIIENGLDIPNANTIIVDRAELFGLAQLYQLRGRVGRGARRAYCYFFYRNAAMLTGEARARLETLAEHTELGAGYSIAMRDLEIRGAGEILGTRQHGQISAVGFDLYSRLLARAVQQRREQNQIPPGEPAAEELTSLPSIVTIELPLDSYLPEEYIPQAPFRFRLYRRMAALANLQAVDEMAAELADRFGTIPDPVDNLLYQIRVKLLASQAGILSIMTVNGQISIRKDGLDQENRMALQRYLGNDVRVSKQAVWLRRDGPGSQPWKVALVQTLERLADWHKAG